MVRALKFHEKKLLKKVDFISWKVDNNLSEVKVMKKYYIQKREDYTLYNVLSRDIRNIANKIKDLDAGSNFRTISSARLLEKLYQMGLIPTRWDLALASSVSASSFCRRRLPVVMLRNAPMEITDSILCIGCLCVGRKMIIIEDYWKKKCFLQILSEIPVMQNVSTPMSLCWECDAIISRFTKFTRQVVRNFEIFQNYLKQNLDLSHIKSTSNLVTHKIVETLITCYNYVDEIKTEKVWDVTIDRIKSEDTSENSGDKEPLIEIKRKKKSRKSSNDKKCNTEVYKEIVLCVEDLEEERRMLSCKEEYINAIYKCENCITVFPNADDLKDHIYLKHEVPSFPCELCSKTFRWKTSLRKHLETHRIETGQKRKPYCETCRLSFTTTSNLQKHVKTSSKHQILLKVRNLKDSPLEDNAEKKRDRIEEIKASVNKQRETFPCPQCDKKFQWRGNLARHMDSHNARAKGDLVCEPCNRTFSSKATYDQHMKVSMRHVSENDFKYMCSECGKRFANKTRLRDHVDWDHLKNYVHKCTDCQKVFKSHTSLYLHKQNVHEKDQAAHLCHHCGKAFPNQAKLRGHVSGLHSREAPYKCGTCNARFSWHSCLSRHVRRVHRKRDTAH
ncbi:U3 small nucleolar ribonucleoprotein IMP3 [Papilio machaon]|uniref:U3 small nucleolar ribonucleoprotein IMP3 n=1 Tax=Papilio machaon TaxID=76193 RepID=A0A0N1PI81_PAPMA|nr:U3 small nucleolar ribonucleoprotein IMP3 [Papilio machaon]